MDRNTGNCAGTKSCSDLPGISAAKGVSGIPGKEAQAWDEPKAIFNFFGWN